jgi:hypothetical protein
MANTPSVWGILSKVNKSTLILSFREEERPDQKNLLEDLFCSIDTKSQNEKKVRQASSLRLFNLQLCTTPAL